MAIEAHQHQDVDSQPGALSRAGSWVSGAAADAWQAGSGAARVAGQFGLGVAEEVYEHPGRTALQVAGGALAAGAAAEAGVTALGAAAIAAVPLAGYGLYRGAAIAATEGFGAIPAHVEQTYGDVRAALSSAGDAVATVYNGRGSDQALQNANSQVENLGRGACLLPLVPSAGAGPSSAN